MKYVADGTYRSKQVQFSLYYSFSIVDLVPKAFKLDAEPFKFIQLNLVLRVSSSPNERGS